MQVQHTKCRIKRKLWEMYSNLITLSDSFDLFTILCFIMYPQDVWLLINVLIYPKNLLLCFFESIKQRSLFWRLINWSNWKLNSGFKYFLWTLRSSLRKWGPSNKVLKIPLQVCCDRLIHAFFKTTWGYDFQPVHSHMWRRVCLHLTVVNKPLINIFFEGIND